MPLRNISGINTEQVVSTDESIGVNTSDAPSATASSSGFPSSARRVILSITIIELSTIIPTPRIRPASDMTLIEIPASLKQSIVSSSSGMLTTMSSGILTSRINAKSTRHASAIPRARFHERLLIEYESRLVWSRVSTNFTPGLSRRTSSNRPSTLSLRSSIRASFCFMTASEIARFSPCLTLPLSPICLCDTQQRSPSRRRRPS